MKSMGGSGTWVRSLMWTAGMALMVAGCGEDEKKPAAASNVVSGFQFEIAVEPTTFAPQAVTPVRVASDGDPDSNPPNTVQLYTPNDSLTWKDGDDGDLFGFDVNLSNYYQGVLCNVRVVVDTIEPADGRVFVEDDRGSEYAGDITGAGVWAYGDVEGQKNQNRRWVIRLKTKEKFTLTGRVLADKESCGAKIPDEL